MTVQQGAGYISNDNLSQVSAWILTIPNGQTVSNSINMNTTVLVGLLIPDFTGTTLSFQISFDDVTFFPVFAITNNAIEITVGTTPIFYGLSPQDFSFLPFLRLVSDAAEGADRDITIVTRKV